MQSKQELELQIDKLKDQLRQAELRAEVLAYEGTGIKQEIQDDKAQTAEKLAAGLADRRSDGDAAASSAAACGPVMAPVVLLPVQPPHQRVEGVFNFDLIRKAFDNGRADGLGDADKVRGNGRRPRPSGGRW
jgi:hypothetical protein